MGEKMENNTIKLETVECCATCRFGVESQHCNRYVCDDLKIVVLSWNRCKGYKSNALG
jgi:hypothetical protein